MGVGYHSDDSTKELKEKKAPRLSPALKGEGLDQREIL